MNLSQLEVKDLFFHFKDTHRENRPSNRTQALTKSMNMDIWVFGTLSQFFIDFYRGSYAELKFTKK